MSFIFVMAVIAIAVLAGVVIGFKNFIGFIVAGVAAVLGLIIVVFSTVTTIDSGTFAVAKIFGKIQPGYYAGNGIQFINPLSDLTVISSKRTSFEIDGPAISSDGNPLTTSVNFPYMPNPTLSWKVLMLIGPDYENTLIKRAAMTAVRDGINAHTWLEANGMKPTDANDNGKTTSLNANAEGRREVEKSIHDAWKRTVVDQLTDSGFTAVEAQNAFDFSDVQLLHALPQQNILDSIALKVAASQEYERQQIITKTAGEIAKRRTAEGEGYNNLIVAIKPLDGQTITASGVAEILHGIADKERADATLSGIEGGKVGTIILSGAPVANTTGK